MIDSARGRRPPSTTMSQARIAEQHDRDRLGFLRDVLTRFGPVVELSPRTFLVADPATVHEILAHTNTRFLRLVNFLEDRVEGRRGAQALDLWSAARRVVITQQATELLDACRPWLAAQWDELADRWLAAGQVHAVQDDLAEVMARFVGRLLFGTRDARAVLDLTRQTLRARRAIVASPFTFPALRQVMPRHRRLRSRSQSLRAAVVQTLHGPGSGGIADALADQLDSHTVVRMLIGNLLGALDAPTAQHAWLLGELAWRPRLADEVAAAAPGSALHTWVVDECLRLWPPAWMLERVTESEQLAGGWLFPANSAVMIPTYLVHRTAECYQRPDEFDPARWAGLAPPRGAFIPFSSGTRRCLGARFATLELLSAVEVLGSRLRLRPLSGPLRPTTGITLEPDELALAVEAR